MPGPSLMPSGTEHRCPPMTLDKGVTPHLTGGFWTRYYRFVFRRMGIRFGKGLKVMGPLLLRIDGVPGNIEIGDYVTLMPWVDIKNRENGRIVLHHGAQVDTMTRLVAANDATIEIGEGASIGAHSIINAGADVRIGCGTLMAGFVYLSASDHGYAAGTPIREQEFEHAPITIGADCWLAAYVNVMRGAIIGDGTVIGTHSRVRGELPPSVLAAGNPAKVIRER